MKEKVSKFQIPTTRSNLETLQPCNPALLPWGVVSAAGAELEVLFHGSDIDGAGASIGIEVGGLVGNVVLAAQFVFNGGEGVRDVFHLVREEGAAAGGGSEVFENFVAAQDQSAVVGGDGIDENFGALRHFNGLGARVFALIVFAVAEDDDGFANGTVGMFPQQLFLARFVNCVIERGAAAIAEAAHSGGEQGYFVGEILGEAAFFVEPYDERAIIAGTNDVLQKSGGCFFFKSKATLHGTAYVHEQAQLHGQPGLAAEVDDVLHGLVVVENREIGLVQIADEFAVAIGSDEQHVDFIDAFLDGEDWFVRLVEGGGGKSGGATRVYRGVGSGCAVGAGLGASGHPNPKNGERR